MVEALAILRGLHVGRNRRPIADTLEQLLAATRAHAGIAIWPTGEQALANVLRVLDMARRFEAQGATSFRAFVDRLDADAESGTAGEAPVVEEGTEGVRIMTVHRAKGLEFPVVILADPTAPVDARASPRATSTRTRGLWAEALAGCMPVELLEHRDEVLAPRPRGERPPRLRRRDARARSAGRARRRRRRRDRDGWLDVLDPVLYPEPAPPARPARGAGLPALRRRQRPRAPAARRARRRRLRGARPARARAPGSAPVVWWDPAALGLGKEPEGGLRQQRILAADASSAVSEEGVPRARRPGPRSAPGSSRAAPTKTLPVRTVTEIVEARARARARRLDARASEGDGAATAWSSSPTPASTGAGGPAASASARSSTRCSPRWTSTRTTAGVAAVARAEGRLMGALGRGDRRRHRGGGGRAAHPLLRRAAASARRGECRRETPVMLPGSGGELIEGVVDLAFREAAAGWTVVDFKTDAEIAGQQGAVRDAGAALRGGDPGGDGRGRAGGAAGGVNERLDLRDDLVRAGEPHARRHAHDAPAEPAPEARGVDVAGEVVVVAQELGAVDADAPALLARAGPRPDRCGAARARRSAWVRSPLARSARLELVADAVPQPLAPGAGVGRASAAVTPRAPPSSAASASSRATSASRRPPSARGRGRTRGTP